MKLWIAAVVVIMALVAAPPAGAADCERLCCYCDEGSCIEAGSPWPDSYSSCYERVRCFMSPDGEINCLAWCDTGNVCYWA